MKGPETRLVTSLTRLFLTCGVMRRHPQRQGGSVGEDPNCTNVRASKDGKEVCTCYCVDHHSYIVPGFYYSVHTWKGS